MTNEYF